MKGSIGAHCLTWACHNADMALWKGNHAVFPKDIKNFRCYDDVKNIPNFIICFLLICFISWKISTITINIADISKNKPFVRISGFVVDTAQNPHFLACVVVNSLPVTNKSWTSPKFKAYGNLLNTVHQSVSKVGKKDRLFCIILFSGHQTYSPPNQARLSLVLLYSSASQLLLGSSTFCCTHITYLRFIRYMRI